jgi:hypothetical protein
MLESSPPRNSRLQTHQNDGTRGEAEISLALGFKKKEPIGLIDLVMP